MAKLISFNKGHEENYFFPLIFLDDKMFGAEVNFVSEQISFVAYNFM
jgi:disulfide oxidoreductase YuzD